MQTKTMLTLALLLLPALGRAADEKPPKSRPPEIQAKIDEFKAGQKTEREAFRAKHQEERKAFEETLKGKTPEQQKAMRQEFRAKHKAERKAFQEEMKAKRKAAKQEIKQELKASKQEKPAQ